MNNACRSIRHICARRLHILFLVAMRLPPSQNTSEGKPQRKREQKKICSCCCSTRHIWTGGSVQCSEMRRGILSGACHETLWYYRSLRGTCTEIKTGERILNQFLPGPHPCQHESFQVSYECVIICECLLPYRYLARSGTWHDLVPGTIWYLARPGRSGTWHDQIWYLARSDNYLID
jgi:hypothetical protein